MPPSAPSAPLVTSQTPCHTPWGFPVASTCAVWGAEAGNTVPFLWLGVVNAATIVSTVVVWRWIRLDKPSGASRSDDDSDYSF